MIALSVFIALHLAFTYPLNFKFNTLVPGFFSTDEIFGVLRQFWWYKYSFLNHLPYTVDPFLAVPFGLAHSKIFIWPLWELLGRFFSVLTNEIFTYNLIIYVSFILSAVFAYHLSYYLTRNRFSGIISGIIYAFCPYYSVRIWQHFGLAQIQWLPLYLLALFRLMDRKTLGSVVFVSLVFALGISFDYQYGYFMCVITIAFMLFIVTYNWRLKLKTRGYLKHDLGVIYKLLAASVLSILLSMPAIYPMLKGMVSSKSAEASPFNPFLRPFEDLFTQSAKPLSYILPPVVHPVFGKFTERFIGSVLYGVSFIEHTLYLGWIPLILAFLAFRRRKRQRRPSIPRDQFYADIENFQIGFFISLLLTAWLFSQPPWWKIGSIRIFMPSFFMYKILPMFRAYCRFGIIVMLAVAVLAGFGLKFVLERFKTRKSRIGITILFCGLILFDFWNYPPFKVVDISKVPQVYYWIQEQPADFVIAEYPLDVDSPNEIYKFYQTKHEKKIINGTMPGTNANNVAKTIIKLSDLQTAAVLKWMGVKYALVHRDDYLNTGLIQDQEELNMIFNNPGIKFIKTFPVQECPQKNIMCVQKTGPVDVYEVVAEPKEPGGNK